MAFVPGSPHLFPPFAPYLEEVVLTVTPKLPFGLHLVPPIVLRTALTVLLLDPSVGVKLFLLLMDAVSFSLPKTEVSVRNILVYYSRYLPKEGVFIGTTTNLRILSLEDSVRYLLPMTPTTGIGRWPLEALLRKWQSGTLSETVVVSVYVTEIVRTVPVLSPDPLPALLVLTTVPLTVQALDVLTFRSALPTMAPTPLMVPRMFPLRQWSPLLL